MPSSSAAQHRLFGYWKSHPDQRPASLSSGQVDEWVHADKGKPWEHRAHGGDVVVRALHHAHQQAQEYGREKRDSGGMAYIPPRAPMDERYDIRGETAPLPQGLIHSPVAGRTDQLPMSPAAGSYVIPADVVSGIGEGNTLAGAAILDKYMGSQPYGVRPAQHSGRHTIPRPPAPYREGEEGLRTPSGWKRGGKVKRTGNVIHYAYGGAPVPQEPGPQRVIHAQPGHDPHEGTPGTVPIIAAGGEYIVPPDAVAFHPGLGNGNPNNPDPKHRALALRNGHAVLDHFVKSAREGHIKQLKKLPGPAK